LKWYISFGIYIVYHKLYMEISFNCFIGFIFNKHPLSFCCRLCQQEENNNNMSVSQLLKELWRIWHPKFRGIRGSKPWNVKGAAHDELVQDEEQGGDLERERILLGGVFAAILGSWRSARERLLQRDKNPKEEDQEH
jgi:hypothetical protein